jgi:AcrR family transcriptional regulator
MTEENAAGSVGLRERKRADTRLRIERAALTTVLERGLDSATIDAIAAAADISSRTFFNYFDSKEAAILGVTGLEELHLDERRSPPDSLAAGVVRLIFDTFGASTLQPELIEERREVLRRHPEVGEAAYRARTEIHQHLTTHIEQQLQTGKALERPRILAAMIAGICLTAAKTVYRAGNEGSDQDSLERETVSLINEAITLLR